MPKPIYKTDATVEAARIRAANSDRENTPAARQRVQSEITKNEIIRGQNSQTAAATAKERLDKQRLRLAQTQGKTTTKTRKRREGMS